VFTPALLNEFRAGFDRVSLGVFQQSFGHNLNAAVGLPTISSNPRDFGLSAISVTGFSSLGDEANNPQHGTTNVYQILDSLTYVHGRHLAKFGFDVRILQQNAYRDVESRGFIDFVGFTGNALAELLMGLPTDSGVARLDNQQHLRSHSYDFFANDNWRIRPTLSLNLGLRYEYNTPAVDALDRANLFDMATQSLVPVGTGDMPRGGYVGDRSNFAPRVGLAWMPKGMPGTVFRAGYGIYYDQSSLAPGEGLYFSPPYFNFNVYYPLGATSPLLLSNPFPANFPLPTPSSALAFQRDLRTPYIQQWNFNIERSLGKGRMAEAGYVGSKGTGLAGARDINQPAPSVGQQPLRPLPQFNDINLLESSRGSVYHSLQARLEQRMQFGLSLLASYTWAKSIDNGSSFFSSAGDPNYPQNSYNLRAERALSNFDMRHRLALSYAYDLPFGKGRLRGGWQTFGILQFQTGQPLTAALLPSFDNANTGISSLGFGANGRPNVVGDPNLSDPTPARWFNTAAFAIAPRGHFGNAGRNVIEGPGLATVNLSLMKNISLTESARLQFRAETFNLFDRANFGLPDNFVGSPTFGQILSAGSPRRLQLGLKLLF
jgi:TonB-dependent receptor-like protein